MTVVVPVGESARLSSYRELLWVEQGHLVELQEWLDPLMKTSLFMHFFNDELQSLPADLLQEVHGQTKLDSHLAADHVLVLDRIPRGDE